MIWQAFFAHFFPFVKEKMIFHEVNIEENRWELFVEKPDIAEL